MKPLAIVYDWIDKWGGAERILSILFREFPEADIYTLYADYKGASWAKEFARRIQTTFLNRLALGPLFKPFLAPLMPNAIESLDLSNYRRVLSLSSSFGKGVITRPETLHLSYLFAPTRFLWHERQSYQGPGFFPNPFFTNLTAWDYVAAQRPDRLITLSRYDQTMIQKYYQRSADILFPPFDPAYWQKLHAVAPSGFNTKKYYLFVGRLEPYKKVDLLVRAFQDLADSLVIVGNGSELTKLQKLATNNIQFYEQVDDRELAWLYTHAEALIMPQSEDFGYTALEALSLGTPVVSNRLSGVADYLRHGQTGYLYSDESPAGIRAAVAKMHTKSYNLATINWQQFSPNRFIRHLKSYLDL